MRVPPPVDGARLSLWRAVAAFRLLTLGVCLYLIVRWQPLYRHAGAATAAGVAMTVWTLVLVALALAGRAHRVPVVLADVVVTAGLTLLTVPAQTSAQQHGAMVTLTTIWAAGPAIEAAFVAGPIGGAVAAVVQYGITVVVAETWVARTLYSGVLLLVTGVVVGLVARLVVRAEEELRRVASAQAALAERERLARSIHDGVLQVLGLVARTGRDAGGTWERLADEATVQEAALRGLITSSPVAVPTGERDLGDDLRALRSARVTVSTPAEPVRLPADVAGDLRDAVRAALHNTEQHAGPDARAWVLLETTDDEVRVTVRDDGVGMSPQRPAEAAADGRIGLARSVRGRVVGRGGRCTIVSAPGAGTEIELVLPW
jgi:signal transduction histidine kinase